MVDTKFKKGLIPWNKGKKTGKPSWNKGIPMREESRKKLSESQKGKVSWSKGKKFPERSGENHPMFGKHHSEESIIKMSEAKKGKMVGEKNPFYGKTHSAEVRKKISEALKGKPSPMKGKKMDKPAWNRGVSPSEELRKKMSEAQKRAQANPEIRRKMVETRKRKGSYKHTEEQKRRISLANKGRKFSEETRKKISLVQKKIWANPEVRERMKKIWTGRKHTPEAIQRMKEAHKKTLSKPEVRERMREAIKRRYENGEVPWNKGKKMDKPAWNKGKKMPELSEWGRQNILKQYESGTFPRQENTIIERQIKEELLKRGYKEGIDFIHQYKFMNKFMCDFCFPQQKVIVETYGDFWHVNPKKYPAGSSLHPHQIKDIKKDRSKEAYITKVDNHAWTYLVLWESDIKRDVTKCVDKIEEVLVEKKNI